MAAGNFTPTILADIQIKADNIWMDNMAKTAFIADTMAMKAIQEQQSAKVSVIETNKDVTASISWIQDCEMEVSAVGSNDCIIDGPELETVSKNLEITQSIKTSFKVERKALRNNMYEVSEIAAKGMLKASKVLDEEVTRRAIAAINGFAGTNEYDGDLGVVQGSGDTHVAALNWDTRLLPYLKLVAIKNRMNTPFMLTGVNYWYTDMDAEHNKGNSDGSGDYVRNQLIKRYYDLFNVELVNSGDLFSYLINRGALAFASKTYNPSVPFTVPDPGQERYSIESRNIPGLRYDVIYALKCINDKLYDVWDFRAYFDFFLNPTGCTDTRTGVLRFKKV